MTDLAPFLGACMVAKLAFNESQGKHYVSKLDYNSHGPSCIHGVWPEN
jgi:actin-related protein 9